MCSRNWPTEVNEAPCSDFPCRIENQISTWLSQEARVGATSQKLCQFRRGPILAHPPYRVSLLSNFIFWVLPEVIVSIEALSSPIEARIP
jgi:hypothetical protein